MSIVLDIKDLKAIEILEDLKRYLFQDHDVWAGYTKRDFISAIHELYNLELQPPKPEPKEIGSSIIKVGDLVTLDSWDNYEKVKSVEVISYLNDRTPKYRIDFEKGGSYESCESCCKLKVLGSKV